MGKMSIVAGGAMGYVLGARAGRGRYEQIKSGAQRAWNNPSVQRRAAGATGLVKDKAASALHVAKDKTASGSGDMAYAAKRAAGAEPTNNEGPYDRQPAPPLGI